MSAGGRKLPRSRPTSHSWASHTASLAWVLRPGTFLNTGRQYTPVASIATCVTCSSSSQPVISRSAE
jgi:hypothetical protein